MVNSKDIRKVGKSIKSQSEDNLQAEIVKWFTNTYCLKHHSPRCLIFSVPNGGTRNLLEAMTLKATGLLSGVSDLIVVLQNKILFVELKTDIGVQSDNQIEFEERITSLGFEYVIVRSLCEFRLIINNSNFVKV